MTGGGGEGITFLWTNRLVSRSSGVFVERMQISVRQEDSTQGVLDSQLLVSPFHFSHQITKTPPIFFICWKNRLIVQ